MPPDKEYRWVRKAVAEKQVAESDTQRRATTKAISASTGPIP